MKIILSRKGFDGNAGGFPSIVYKNNFYSFPIPQTDGNGISYENLEFYNEKKYSTVFKELGIEVNTLKGAHLDPDLKKSIYKREIGWKPIFGQAGSAEAHLKNNKVDKGDIFLFFGWFKFAEDDENNKIEYCNNKEGYENGFHAIFGYLEVDEKINLIEKNYTHSSFDYHPHLLNRNLYNKKKHNTIYFSKNIFSYNINKTGAGLLKFDESLILTGKNCSKGVWHLDDFFQETTRFSKFTDHIDNGKIKVPLKGYYPQELMITENHKVKDWAIELISKFGVNIS